MTLVLPNKKLWWRPYLTYTGNCTFSSQLKILFWFMKWWLVWCTVLIPIQKCFYKNWPDELMFDGNGACHLYESKIYNNFVVSNWEMILHMPFFTNWTKIRQSKINSRSVAGPMAQMNRRPSVWCSKYFFFFMISRKILCKNPFDLFFYFFIKLQK